MIIMHNMTHKTFMSLKMLNGPSFFQNYIQMSNNKIQLENYDMCHSNEDNRAPLI